MHRDLQAFRMSRDDAQADRAEIQRSLGRIEGQLNSLASSFVQHLVDDAANFKELKLSTGSLQKKLWTFGGFFLAVGYAISHSDKLIALVVK